MTGCSKISEECAHCYAEALSLRYGWTRHPWTEPNAAINVQERPERLKLPGKFKLASDDIPHPRYPIRVFVNSMSDMFHERVNDGFLRQVFAVMNMLPDRIFQVLTKRPERAAEWPGPWTDNIWLGTTCGHERTRHRIDTLRTTAAAIKFVSIEPLLTALPALDLTGIDQILVGGESGPGFRPMSMDWARDLRDQAAAKNVAYFFKQDASFRTESRCYLVEADGRCMEYRQFPNCLTPPREVRPDNEMKHRELFRVVA